MSRFTRHLFIAAIALAALAPAAGAAVYQHSLGLSQSSVATTYAHSPDLNPYSHVLAVSDSQPTPTVSVAPSSTFDWADAGIGAGALATVLLLVSATTIVVRRSSGRRLAV